MAKTTGSAALSFEHLHAAGRHLLLEMLGRERDPEALSASTQDLFGALPDRTQEEVWRELGARQDRLNAFLAYGDHPVASTDRPETANKSSSDTAVEISAADPLRHVPLRVAFEILTGTEVSRSGMVRCPLHDDSTPSCHVEHELFYCFGCLRGGSLVDLGAALYGLGTRGEDYFEVRRRLALDLLGTEA